MNDARQIIEEGKAVIGIELGSTRIKAVLIDAKGNILEKGGYSWENHLIDGIWTYGEDEIWHGLQQCYLEISRNVKKKYGIVIRKVSAIGISGMMHGYMPFDKKGRLLTPFRTWRNNTTKVASDELTELFEYNIPQRWSIAHLYQAILNEEEHVAEIDYITTLAGYVHWKLTGKKVIGIGDASGMFPIDIELKTFNKKMITKFKKLISYRKYFWKLEEVLPKVLVAGQSAGTLTKEGALLLDLCGNLQPGIELCPPEGDAGTGMVATNSIAEKTGNISAGTSAFAMVVLEKELSRVYKELDMVTTPVGKLVAMAHSNNCSSDINAWVSLFSECLKEFGISCNIGDLYEKLFIKAEEGEPNCGKLLSYCFYSGEHSVGLTEGCPLFIHPANARFNLANFMRVQLYTAFGAMKLGLDFLIKQEHVEILQILGHGGMFKTKGVAQGILAAAIGIPIAVMETSGEGGAWGIALLAAFLKEHREGKSLEVFLNETVFKKSVATIIKPDVEAIQGYEEFISNYKKGLMMEYEAVSYLKK